MSDITIGEALSRRRLKTEPYGSKTIYSPDQTGAARLGPTDVVLSWVDTTGGLCIVPCERINDEWFHRGIMIYCSVDNADRRFLARGFALTSPMLIAIKIGMQKKTRRPVGTPDDES